MDTWMRQVFVPALDQNARVIVAGREPPLPGVVRGAPSGRGLFRSVPLGPLQERDALEFSARCDVGEEAAGEHQPDRSRASARAQAGRLGADRAPGPRARGGGHAARGRGAHAGLPGRCRDPLTRRGAGCRVGRAPHDPAAAARDAARRGTAGRLRALARAALRRDQPRRAGLARGGARRPAPRRCGRPTPAATGVPPRGVARIARGGRERAGPPSCGATRPTRCT